MQQTKKISRKKTVISDQPENKHYTKIRVKNFRLFEDITFDNLGRVNIFLGPNNSGKTSALEAVFTHASGMNFMNAINQLISGRQSNVLTGYFDMGKRILSIFNRIENSQCNYIIEGFFKNEYKQLLAEFSPSSDLSILDPKNIFKNSINFKLEKYPISVSMGGDQGFDRIPQQYVGTWKNQFNDSMQEIEIFFPRSENKNKGQHYLFGYLTDILSHRETYGNIPIFSHLKSYGLLNDFINDINSAFPDIKNIDSIPYPDGSMNDIFVQTNNGKNLSLNTFGDGMRRWFYILGNFIVHQNAIHCIEEIDATFHFEALEILSTKLVEYSKKYNNQLFLTSHSMEFIDIFLKAIYEEKERYFDNGIDPVQIYRLYPQKDTSRIEVWTMTGSEAFEQRQKFNLELR